MLIKVTHNMPIRPLSAELQEKAEKEINEVPSQVQENLEYIKDWISKQPHLKARTDDQWLIAFLRGCKFSLERTKEKLDLFYSVRKLVPEFFANRDPLSPEIQAVLNAGIFTILPQKPNDSGPTIMVTYSPVKIYPENVSLESLIKVQLMILEIMYLENDNCTVAGQCIIADVNHLSYKYVGQLTAAMAKKFFMCLENIYPTRVKAIHAVNTPSFIVTLYHTLKFLLTEKLRNRFNIYTEGNTPSVYKSVPISILPKEFGGDGASHAILSTQMKLKVESYRDWFLEDAQYCTDETKRLGKNRIAEDNFGVEGSFRKLNLD